MLSTNFLPLEVTNIEIPVLLPEENILHGGDVYRTIKVSRSHHDGPVFYLMRSGDNPILSLAQQELSLSRIHFTRRSPYYWILEVAEVRDGQKIIRVLEDLIITKPGRLRDRPPIQAHINLRFWQIDYHGFRRCRDVPGRLSLRTRQGRLVAAWQLDGCSLGAWTSIGSGSYSFGCSYKHAMPIRLNELPIEQAQSFFLKCNNHLMHSDKSPNFYGDNGAFFVDWARQAANNSRNDISLDDL